MNDNQFPYLMYENNKSDSSSDSSEKRKNHYILKSFAKFKPKNVIKNEQNKRELKGAEHKVKNLLSDYIKNIELEKKSNKKSKNKKLTNKNSSSITSPKKIKKRNTIITHNNLKLKNMLNIENENIQKSSINSNFT